MANTFVGRQLLKLRRDFEEWEARTVQAESLYDRMWDCLQKKQMALKLSELKEKLGQMKKSLELLEKEVGYRVDDERDL